VKNTKRKIGVVLVLIVLLLMPISVYAATCPGCGGTGVIYRELRYQIIDDSVSVYGVLDWKADIVVTIRNLDDKTGYFKVTGIARGKGGTLTNTVGTYIDAGAVEDVTVTLDIKFDAEYEYDYSVEPETLEITCPECGGTGEVTPGFETIFAITGLLAAVYFLRRRK
jgi:PGF-CTERM protein